MSDGPHRSLPMRQHWKDLAERVENFSFTPEETAEALFCALEKDFRGAPLSVIRAILDDTRQGFLFKENHVEQLDATRQTCPGLATGNTLIDCAIEANSKGMIGDSAFHHAVKNALEAHALSGCRQIEEHQYREAPENGQQVRERLLKARIKCPYDTLASKLMSDPQSNDGLSKRTGIDEGPKL